MEGHHVLIQLKTMETMASGCNLNHDSKDCRSVRRKTDHKNEATLQNPMGGNTAKDAFWNKWWNPVEI